MVYSVDVDLNDEFYHPWAIKTLHGVPTPSNVSLLNFLSIHGVDFYSTHS